MKRYTVVNEDGKFRVYDIKEDNFVTIYCPEIVANEIAEDFNKMYNFNLSDLTT